MSISYKTCEEVSERDHGCQVLEDGEICGDTFIEIIPHHCWFRSKYHGKDRDKAWNLCMICKKHHYAIHHGSGMQSERKRLEQVAFDRATKETKEKLRYIK